jgi:hypothetical protein
MLPPLEIILHMRYQINMIIETSLTRFFRNFIHIKILDSYDIRNPSQPVDSSVTRMLTRRIGYSYNYGKFYRSHMRNILFKHTKARESRDISRARGDTDYSRLD